MKKLTALLILFSLSTGYGVTQQRSLGNARAYRLSIDSATIASIGTLTADATNQLIVCSDCQQSVLCISSGSTAAGQWVIPVATGTFLSGITGFPHCK